MQLEAIQHIVRARLDQMISPASRVGGLRRLAPKLFGAAEHYRFGPFLGSKGKLSALETRPNISRSKNDRERPQLTNEWNAA